ncbi:DUF5615 family PIN-like protein [Synechococcus sp. J7-Johnson]|uniref:DUF5615 family PIN-like protein n=1 Tax=Synechococcus sp. J7-Johnson TaxID=2823737 RepID=UPI0037DA3DAE
MPLGSPPIRSSPSFLILSRRISRRPLATPPESWITAQFAPIQAVPVRELGLRDADDREIFAQARSAGAVVMTKDRDFLHLLFEQGPPPQVIWLRVGTVPTRLSRPCCCAPLSRLWPALVKGSPGSKCARHAETPALQARAAQAGQRHRTIRVPRLVAPPRWPAAR